MTMLEFITRGFKGSAVKYSPFYEDRICVAASANYGLVGNGRLYSLMLTAQGIQVQKTFDTQDSIYDLSWSESNENQVAVACGDGSVKLFDTALNEPFPVGNFHEHSREVFAVHWNLVSKDTFVSSSWDGTIKLWNPNRQSSLLTLPTHSCTYSTAFSPHSPSVISSVSSDSHLRIFDLRTPASASNHLVSLIPIHGPPPTTGTLGAVGSNRQIFPPSEALTHDWNKYRDGVIATAGVDQMIRTFDIRNPGAGPIAILQGHDYAVRKLVWSPHLSDTLLSASYDMSCRIWTDGTSNASMPRQLGRMDVHTEFATGVDWCLFGEGWCASTAWDERLLVWDVRSVMGA
ncbi:11eb2ef0-9ac7-4347-a35b-7c86b476df99 [Sclerotinia trifoliorum]|uniref:Peroxin-7 n=1 Tax=Sclerotinia trifoliorum TaxID=28548 RepID=A0A8H2ZRD3_9HELO|nr:11eb2ef0-9ac7-4347-a35b-7c86b476df99 [Sclerotinia trifoliorum]